MAPLAPEAYLPSHCRVCSSSLGFQKPRIWECCVTNSSRSIPRKDTRPLDELLRQNQQQPHVLMYLQRTCIECESEDNFHPLWGGTSLLVKPLSKPQLKRRIKSLRVAYRKQTLSRVENAAVDDGQFLQCEGLSHDLSDDASFNLPYEEITMDSEEVADRVYQVLNCQHESESKHDYVAAAKEILGKASLQRDFSKGHSTTICKESFDLYLAIGELVLSLDQLSREKLSTVLQLSLEEHDKHNTGNPAFLNYPRTEKEFQSHFLNPNNKNSLVNNIPVPEVISMDGGSHSYTNFLDLIKFISKTTECSDKTKNGVKQRHQSLIHSPKFLEFFDANSQSFTTEGRNVIVMIFLWSDGFDPNRTKTNRGSAWALTGTYIFYDVDKQKVYMVKTELISCGTDKDDHSSIFRQMSEDLQALYSESGQLSSLDAPSLFHEESNVRFFPVIMGCLMDNPERRLNFGLKNGNSNGHGCFGISAHIRQLEKTWSPCEDCRTQVETYIEDETWDQPCFQGRSCSKCIGFDLDRLTQGARYKEPLLKPPLVDGVDNDLIPGIHLSRGPGHLSSGLLLEAWAYAKIRFVNNQWSAAVTKTYLGELFCLNEYQVSRFVSDCHQIQRIDLFKTDPSSLGPEDTLEVQRILHEDPCCQEKLCLPPGIWKLLTIDQAFECIMHQAMNAGKAISKMAFQWTTSNSKTTAVFPILSPKLKAISDLRSSRFKIFPFKTPKMGGFCGEDHKTFIATAPWSMRFLTDESMSPPSMTLPSPDKAVSKMTVPELRAWLILRNVPFEAKALRKELQNIVRLHVPPKKTHESQWNDFQLTAWLSARGHFQSSGCTHDELVSTVLALKSDPATCKLREFDVQSTKECGLLLRKMYSALNSYHSSLVCGDICGAKAENRSQAYAMRLLYLSISFLTILVGKDNAEPTLFKKCTMFGILRCATHFRHIYQLKSLDEGGENGEGFVKAMRRHLTHGLKEGWTLHLQGKMHRQTGIDHLQWCVTMMEDVGSVGSQVINKSKTLVVSNLTSCCERDFRKYKCLNDFYERRGDCLSFVVFADTGGFHFGLVEKVKRDTWQYHKVMPGECVKDGVGFRYFEMSLDPSPYPVTDRNPLTVCVDNLNRRCSIVFTVAIGLPFYQVDRWVHAVVLPDGRHLSCENGNFFFKL